MLNLAGLLLHSADVPLATRTALTSALAAPADARRSSLVEAARTLAFETGIGCEDACELVGLGDACCDDAAND